MQNVLRNSYNVDKEAYNKKQNYYVSPIRKTKQDYYNTLGNKKVADYKSFWKYIKPFFFPVKTLTLIRQR